MVRAAKSKIAKKDKSDRLYQAILTLETEEECYNFFQDLCTISELRSMEQRYEVATLLNDGMINRIHPTKKFHKFSFILLQISPP